MAHLRVVVQVPELVLLDDLDDLDLEDEHTVAGHRPHALGVDIPRVAVATLRLDGEDALLALVTRQDALVEARRKRATVGVDDDGHATLARAVEHGAVERAQVADVVHRHAVAVVHAGRVALLGHLLVPRALVLLLSLLVVLLLLLEDLILVILRHRRLAVGPRFHALLLLFLLVLFGLGHQRPDGVIVAAHHHRLLGGDHLRLLLLGRLVQRLERHGGGAGWRAWRSLSPAC
mmetsp:Transcript_46225/g.128451  ORF Transcript_46225/g.128451 Transcript_46225/m.128451 type:complete len:233 (-) Transcript_46225:5-703(-)